MAVVDDPEGAAERRARITRDLMEKTGIDDAMIERLVRAFYARVQADPLIGPVFAARIEDWEAHIVKLCAFWSSVALMTGRYHGQPMQAHLGLPVAAEHFDRWIAIFEATANELCPPAAATHVSSTVHDGSPTVLSSAWPGVGAESRSPRFSTVVRQSVRPSPAEPVSCG